MCTNYVETDFPQNKKKKQKIKKNLKLLKKKNLKLKKKKKSFKLFKEFS